MLLVFKIKHDSLIFGDIRAILKWLKGSIISECFEKEESLTQLHNHIVRKHVVVESELLNSKEHQES